MNSVPAGCDVCNEAKYIAIFIQYLIVHLSKQNDRNLQTCIDHEISHKRPTTCFLEFHSHGIDSSSTNWPSMIKKNYLHQSSHHSLI